MTGQPTLFDAPSLNARQQEVYEALRKMVVAGDTAAIQATIAEYIPVPRERSCIAKRLCEMEAMGLVERTGRNMDRAGHPAQWRRR